jgi:iron complex outermembrane recepter protein
MSLKHFTCAVLLAAPLSLFPQDTTKTYILSPVEIISTKITIGESQFPVQKDNLASLIGQNGFSLIRKGAFFAQDISADGMKRGDINIVIDGERYHCACPNRMDSPLSRVNPLELESVDLTKTSVSAQSGLGGVVNFHRAIPREAFALKGGLTGSIGALRSQDGAFSLEGYGHRLSFRYASGDPYQDASNRDFHQLYGYVNNTGYSLAEGSVQGVADLWAYGVTISHAENVTFPYLKMDERRSSVASSFVSFNGNKIYFNYTNHIMNNDLRVRPVLSTMETDATNLTIGVVGSFYDAYYRNWNADNWIVMANGMNRINNKLMPAIHMYAASVSDTVNYGTVALSGKAGVVYFSMGETSRLGFYQVLFPNAKKSRALPTFGASATFTRTFSEEFGSGIMAEAASEAPETEYLYAAVTRPKGSATWAGNPTLRQPVRGTVRGSLVYDRVQLELYATHIWDYTNLAKATVNQVNYQTYGNINALMLGTNLSARFEYVEIDAGYIWAKNRTTGRPLAEIAPLKISTKLVTPGLHKVSAYLKHTYNDAQTRVDVSLSERTTPAYNKFDVGLTYALGYVQFSLEAENITNTLYYQHLSYLRDPFASGALVYEPGRTIRLSMKLNEIL